MIRFIIAIDILGEPMRLFTNAAKYISLYTVLISVLFLARVNLVTGDAKTQSNREPTIYIAGEGRGFARYWKNGKTVKLTDEVRFSTANSIYVSNGDVYVVGNIDDTAVCWKNGNETILNADPSKTKASANSVYVYSNDVYIAGCENGIAKYWKNGVSINLSDNTSRSSANSIFVSNGDVYVAGCETNFSPIIKKDGSRRTRYYAKYWKNGVAYNLTDGSSFSLANSITIDGKDIYVAGIENLNAKYWKNGEPFILSTSSGQGGRASSIFVSGSDIYVAGVEFLYLSKYWKNGVAVHITDGRLESFVTSIFVFNDDVYIIGGESDYPGYGSSASFWKNGKRTNIGYSLNKPNSIFIVP